MAKSTVNTNADPITDPEPPLGLEPLDPGEQLDQADPEPDRDPLDATDPRFTDSDADARGWIVFREPMTDGVQRYHLVPVAHWAAYEKSHGF